MTTDKQHRGRYRNCSFILINVRAGGVTASMGLDGKLHNKALDGPVQILTVTANFEFGGKFWMTMILPLAGTT